MGTLQKEKRNWVKGKEGKDDQSMIHKHVHRAAQMWIKTNTCCFMCCLSYLKYRLSKLGSFQKIMREIAIKLMFVGLEVTLLIRVKRY